MFISEGEPWKERMQGLGVQDHAGPLICGSEQKLKLAQDKATKEKEEYLRMPLKTLKEI